MGADPEERGLDEFEIVYTQNNKLRFYNRVKVVCMRKIFIDKCVCQGQMCMSRSNLGLQNLVTVRCSY